MWASVSLNKLNYGLDHPFISSDQMKNTNLVTILAEVVPVRLDNWQRQLGDIVDTHLWMALRQMVDL